MQVPRIKYEKLSDFLRASLPSREDMVKICKAVQQSSVLNVAMLTMPYTFLEQQSPGTPECLLDITEANHPILLARHMLRLATFLQHLHPNLHKEFEGPSESPRVIMERVADLAIRLVTTNEELLGSIEGLECVMIEGVYHMNMGNLRRSWVTIRRAMGIAQLMGLHRQNSRAQFKTLGPKTKYHPQTMWFRIVDIDRFLCLLLGLPPGCPDRGMMSDLLLGNDTPMGRLEQIHCVLASRILERNESTLGDMGVTRNIDVELQKAGRTLASKWWLTPNLAVASADPQALFWETRRLFAQILHYNLLNQLHLPYMLRSSSTGQNHDYSRTTCVNASREMLTRYLSLRGFNQVVYSCRTVDFVALMAAMALLLAHMDSQTSDAENLLAHQYQSDRAMIEQVQDNMEVVNRLNSDTLSAQSADLLRRLLAVEVEAGDVRQGDAGTVCVQEAGIETARPDGGDDSIVSVHVPYFGTIKIARKGVSMWRTELTRATTTANRPSQAQPADGPNMPSNEGSHAQARMHHSELHGHCGTPMDQVVPSLEIDPAAADASWGAHALCRALPLTDTSAKYVAKDAAPQLEDVSFDHLFQYDDYPGLIADSEDWAFQGSELAFFGSLTGDAGHEKHYGADQNGPAEASVND